MNLNQAIEQDLDQEENAGDGQTDDQGAESKVKVSLRKAINFKCRDCIYDDQATGLGPWRMQVEACTVTCCPLFEVRPRAKPRKR